jgi:predicted nucleic acid-binding protein
VLYVLCSQAHYNLSWAEAAARMRSMLTLRGLRIEHKRRHLRALKIYAGCPASDFADVVSVALMEAGQVTAIVSYARDFNEVPGIQRIEP